MTKYQLEQYEDQLNHQVIHMDQAVCYCPEFRATKMMHHYPSRRLQLARAVYKGETALTDYIGRINFASILSRQGERWQNFRESPEDCTDVTILCREMLLKKGYRSMGTEAFKQAFENGLTKAAVTWDLPVDRTSKKGVLLDLETARNAKEGESRLKAYLDKQEIAFVNQAGAELAGFEFFAYGLVEEGTRHLKELIDRYADMNIEELYVLSAQAAYMFTVFAAKLGLEVPFQVVYLPEQLEVIDCEERTYVYAGSFNLRYLMNGEMLNRLVPGESTVQEPYSQEFTPFLKGNKRINQLTIWQKPVCAEYQLHHRDEKLQLAIEDDACADIERSGADTILVFEPAALPVLRRRFSRKNVVYYLEML
ncbi:MAG: hypothetical protein LIP16_00985 [Clostridium sp.]|nr:hypothetical protein [Clostridium sp.]